MDVPTYRSPDGSLLDTYTVRILLGLVASLGLLIALVHLPVEDASVRVGWTTAPTQERIPLSDVRQENAGETSAPTVVTNAAPSPDTEPIDEPKKVTTVASGPSGDDLPEELDSSDSKGREISAISMIDQNDETPKIRGGIGALYPKINYPKKAREQGIEGTLELEFVVQTDGSVTNVKVVDSLHPLCDSAAVQGIRSVEFAPATQDGRRIPIRMSLPIHFRLITTPGAPQMAGMNSKKES